MKKLLIIALLPALLLLFVASCMDPKDFDMDKLSTSDVRTTLAVPLFKDSLYLKPGDDLPIKYLEDGAVAFYFAVPQPDLPAIVAMADIPEQEFIMPHTEIPNPGADLPDLSAVAVSSTVTIPFSGDARVDKVEVSNMVISIDNQSNFASTYTISFTAPGAATGTTRTLQVASGATASLPLDDMTLNLKDNKFVVTVSLTPEKLMAPNAYVCDATITLNSATPKVAHGYFGKIDVPTTPSVTVDAFDKIAGTCNLEEAYLSFTAVNHTGIPVKLALRDAWAATTHTGPVDSVTIKEATDINTGITMRDPDTRIGGPALGPVLNAIISKAATEVGFSFYAQTNPEGEVPNKPNFITAAAAANPIEISDVEVVVPMRLKADNLTFSETLDVNFPEDYTFDELIAKVYAVNSMPVKVQLQGELFREDGMDPVTHTPFIPAELFETPVTLNAAAVDDNGMVVSPTVSNEDAILSAATIALLQKADKIKMTLTVESPDDGLGGRKKVVITKQNYVKLQVGVKATVNLDDIDDDL